eukprot:1782212-Rhodomonas_salina.1
MFAAMCLVCVDVERYTLRGQQREIVHFSTVTSSPGGNGLSSEAGDACDLFSKCPPFFTGDISKWNVSAGGGLFNERVTHGWRAEREWG